MDTGIKIIVYSLDINGYDEIINPLMYDKNVRYILFSDDKTKTSKFWEVIYIDNIEELDYRKLARYYKVNSHLVLPEHEISIYVDSSFTFNVLNISLIFEENDFSNCELMCYKHFMRNCTYEESGAVIDLKTESEEVVSEQMSMYENEGFPKEFGLFETGLMIRRNNVKVNQFNSVWWEQIKNFSGRDQLSQVYSSWKSGVNICSFKKGDDIYSNSYLTKFRPHKKKWLVN